MVILGSGTCVPSLARSSCAVLIEGEEENFLLDIGPGTIRQLLKAGRVIWDIDAIFLSHFHPDHCSELPAFLFAIKYPEMKRKKEKLLLAGGTGLNNFFNRLDSTFENHLDLGEFLKIVELDPRHTNQLVFKDFTVDFAQTAHKSESRAFKFTDSNGFTVVYSGDTDFSENLIRLAKESDILIIESAFPDNLKVKGHLTPSLAGEIAAQANVKTLVLTHFYPECDRTDIHAQCRKKFSGPLYLAEDLLTINF